MRHDDDYQNPFSNNLSRSERDCERELSPMMLVKPNRFAKINRIPQRRKVPDSMGEAVPGAEDEDEDDVIMTMGKFTSIERAENLPQNGYF